jgi:magnesium-transporting ATPase (P-type)
MANLVGQVGCVTGLVALAIIGISFALGQFLDNQFAVRGIFTVILMLGSFPVTLFAMVKLSLYMVAKAQARVEALEQQEKAQTQTNTTSGKEETHL